MVMGGSMVGPPSKLCVHSLVYTHIQSHLAHPQADSPLPEAASPTCGLPPRVSPWSCLASVLSARTLPTPQTMAANEPFSCLRSTQRMRRGDGSKLILSLESSRAYLARFPPSTPNHLDSIGFDPFHPILGL